MTKSKLESWTMARRESCPACDYTLANPVPGEEPFDRVLCHQCGVTLGCTRPCYLGDAMYSDGTFGGGDMSTCAEAHASFALMSVMTEPRHRETLVGYLCPACADATMKSWADKPDESCNFAITPRPP